MTTVLLTAFEPYDRWSKNASWLALVALTRNMPETPKIVTRLYPVDFDKARQRLSEDLSANYDFALHLGQAPGSARIRLESVGLNRASVPSRSAAECQVLDPTGPAACMSELPLETWANNLRSAGIPASVSHHAGTYLCNALLYYSLYLAKLRGLKTQSAFIHVPLAAEQVVAEATETAWMPAEMVAESLRLILADIVNSANQTLE